MTVQQAEAILLEFGVGIAFQHRFCGDRGTILRLENYAMINIFDDGRYYIQGKDIAELLAAFSLVEPPWDTDTWKPEPLLPWFPPPAPNRRFDL
jgi:hypothetical protein